MRLLASALGLLLGIALSSSPLCFGQEITVAAASDLQFVLPEIAARFEKESGKHVTLIFGSSGNFSTQIENGAPFDLFFSADIAYPKKLEADGLTEPGTLYQYATGRIVLWTLKTLKFDLTRGLQVLLDPAVKKIAIANPQHAPYGRAAVAAMRQEKIYDKVTDKLILGENISQTATFVASGSAEIGIVALSLAMSPAMRTQGRCGAIPAADYPAIEQAAVVLKSSKQKDAARQFLSLLKSPESASLFRQYGFAVPSAAVANPETKITRGTVLPCM